MTELKPPSPNRHEPQQTPAASECIVDLVGEEMADYHDYYDAIKQHYPDAGMPINRMRNKNSRMYETVLMGRNPPKREDVEAEPGDSDFDDEKTLLMKGVREWYQTLGSLNSLKGAGDDLLRGAMIILASNSNEDYVFQQQQQSSMFEAYMESSRANDLEKQESNEFLVLAGQMINEASLVAEDEDSSRRLLSEAAGIYSRVYKDPDAGWDYKYKRDAARYLHALELSNVARNIKRYEEEENPEEAGRWRNAYEAVQRISIADLQSILASEQSGLSNGELGEQFYDILARDVVITEGRQHDISVRPAFLRQDKPHDFMARDYGGLMAFDLRIGDHLIQVKAYQNIRENSYIPEIRTVGMHHESNREVRRDMLKTLQAVMNVYNGVASDTDFELFVDREEELVNMLQN